MRLSLSPLLGWALLLVAVTACTNEPALAPKALTYSVRTLAGGALGRADGVGPAAQFSQPSAVAVDGQGNVYVADRSTHLIRRVTPAGVVTTLAGGGSGGTRGGDYADGVGRTARFFFPQGLAVDARGNLYVGDSFNHRIRQLTPAGVVSTIAGTGSAGRVEGDGSTAQFYNPYGVAVGAQGVIYVADYSNECIRTISPTGDVRTLAGSGVRGYQDGPATTARFHSPQGIAVDRQGNVYVAEIAGHRIRKITPTGVVSTLAGTGKEGYQEGFGSNAQFSLPQGVAVDEQGNVYVADSGNHRIRLITPQGVVSTLAGTGAYGSTDGKAKQAQFDNPTGIAVAADGALYVTDCNTDRIRVISPE